MSGKKSRQKSSDSGAESGDSKDDDLLKQLVSKTVELFHEEAAEDDNNESDSGGSEVSTEHEDDGKAELNKAIADAFKVDFDEKDTSKDSEDEIHKAQATLNKEIEDAFGEGTFKESSDDSDLKDTDDNDGEKNPAAESNINMHDVIYAALRDLDQGSRNTGSEDATTPPADTSQVELSKAIEEALQSPIDKRTQKQSSQASQQQKQPQQSKPPALEGAQSTGKTKDPARTDETEDQWASIMENALEMASENPEALLSSLEADQKKDRAGQMATFYRSQQPRDARGSGPVTYVQSSATPKLEVQSSPRDSSKKSIHVRQQGILESIMSSFGVSNLTATEVARHLTDEQITAIKSTVLHYIAESTPGVTRTSETSIEKMSDDERRKFENRERKKRWREMNFERNRDNDLRTRVMKRAEKLHPNPGQEAARKQWIAQEFAKRKQKRFTRERLQLEEILGIRYVGLQPDNYISVGAALSDANFLHKVADVCNALGEQVTADSLSMSGQQDADYVTRAISVAILCSYVANSQRFDNSKLKDLAHPVVLCLGNIIAQYSTKRNKNPPRQVVIVPQTSNASASEIPVVGKIDPEIRAASYEPEDKPAQISNWPTPKSQSMSPGTPKRPATTHVAKKPKKSRKADSEPVDFSNFLLPHPPPASLISRIKSNTYRASELNSMQSSESLNSLRSESEADYSDAPEMRPVKLPHYKKPEVGPGMPRPISSIRASSIISQRPSDSQGKVLARPGYYGGLRKPGAFKKPQGFKEPETEGIRKPFYGIVPVKRE